MKNVFLIIILLSLIHCSKPKTVLICGDHICVNKTEAEDYFKKNLSIEVKIIDNKKKEDVDLIELNLNSEPEGEKRILLTKKNDTDKKLKTLTNKEIIEIKKKLKKRKKVKEIAKKKPYSEVKKVPKKDKIVKKKSHVIQKSNKIVLSNVNNNANKVFDICTILEKCSIDEISKYLLKEGKDKDFPDITTRQ